MSYKQLFNNALTWASLHRGLNPEMANAFAEFYAGQSGTGTVPDAYDNWYWQRNRKGN